ncbi:MAG TPA: CofH family radical SAM protein [Deltaproteobacteria bacterium]|nr:CofH family radical SAM protein [Deltaproteobacteria bacterium]HOM28462.1 CofH family radical SAM protein [Deltaproteobacteria bacterium]HPP81223.1 CofH family radical SAM protein [Deltaproteobacteria bacterium]
MSNTTKELLRRKIYEGRRIMPEEALDLFSWDLPELGMAADFRRRMAVPGDTVGFIVDRIINFTNVCEAACAFCAFHAKPGGPGRYESSMDEICGKVEELVINGGTQVMLQGGLHPDYTLETYVNMVRTIKGRFPEVVLHSFSPAEIVHMARKGSLSLDQVVEALKEAGLDSVPGASDILVDRVRSRVCPNKLTAAQWRSVMHCLARHGMKSSATMTYGLGETMRERVEHLGVIREVQDQTGIIRAFIPWSFSSARTSLADMPPSTGLDYLRIVAVSRIFLDNIPHIQAGWLTEGTKLAQVALSMGADDMGGVLTEEVVVRATGIATRTNVDEMIHLILDAGKTAVQRDSDYREIRRFG